MAHWLFHGNPKYYCIVDAIQDFEHMTWLVTRYAKDMAITTVVICMANRANFKVSSEQWQRVFELRG